MYNRFKYLQSVRIINTTDKKLDGLVAQVVGVSDSYPNCEFLILKLPYPQTFSDGNRYSSLVMIDSCLEKV